MKEIVSNRIPKTSPSFEQSKAFVWVGSSFAGEIFKLLSEFLQLRTNSYKEERAIDGTTVGMSSTVRPWAILGTELTGWTKAFIIAK